MFTGIVQATAPVVHVVAKPGLTTLHIRFPQSRLVGLKKGASVAVDGVCLTVVKINAGIVTFQAMQETLDKTTLGQLRKGQKVNIERSLRAGDEIGGHLVSGHVTGTAQITKVTTPENNHICTFKAQRAWMPYIFPKGFIALDGASLTIVDVDRKRDQFTIHFIPETLRKTTFGWKRAGDAVNMEIDARTQAIVETIQQIYPSIRRAPRA